MSILTFSTNRRLAVFASLLMISRSGWEIARQHSPLVEETEKLQMEASLFHLWFEELVQGDATIVQEKVWNHLKQAERHAGALIHGGESSEDTAFSPPEDELLQEEISQLLLKLYELKLIAHHRLEKSSSSAIGSDMDQKFDAAFERLLLQVDKVDAALHQVISDETDRFQFLAMLLLGFTVAGAVGIAFLLRYYEGSRQLAEAKVKNSESSLNEAQKVAHVGSWHWDVKSDRSYYSEEACRIFGTDPENNQGSYISFLRFVHPEDRRQVKADVVAAMHTQKETYDGEFRIIRSNGETRFVHARGEGEYDSSGKAVSVIGTVWDITERKLAEQALRESEIRYQDMYDNAPDMHVSVIAETTGIRDCNQTLANNLGYSKEEIIGRPIFDMYHPDCMKKVQEAFHCFIATGEIHNAELQLKRKDGSKIDVLLNVSAIRDEKGKVLYSRSVWRDITERKQAENQLQEAFDELKVKSERLERFQKVTIGREMDMLYLKEEINLLLERLGEPKKYETPDRIRGK